MPKKKILAPSIWESNHRDTDQCTTPAMQCLYLGFKQLFIDRSSMCSDHCKNHGCKQKIREGTSFAMFQVRTIAKCCEFKRCTSTRFDVTRVTQVGKMCSDRSKKPWLVWRQDRCQMLWTQALYRPSSQQNRQKRWTPERHTFRLPLKRQLSLLLSLLKRGWPWTNPRNTSQSYLQFTLSTQLINPKFCISSVRHLILVTLWCVRTDVRMDGQTDGRTVTWLLRHYQNFLAW